MWVCVYGYVFSIEIQTAGQIGMKVLGGFNPVPLTPQVQGV